MKILFVFFHGIGDAIMFIPALRMYKEKNPENKIGILCTPLIKEIFENCPYVDEVFISKNKSPRYGLFPLYWKDRFKIMLEAKKITSEKKYDKNKFIIPQNAFIPVPGIIFSTFPFLYRLDKNEIKKFCKILKVEKNKQWPEEFYTESFGKQSEIEKANKFIKKIKGKVAVVHFGSTSNRRGFNENEKEELGKLLISKGFKIISLYDNFFMPQVYPISPKTISFTIGLIKKCDLFLGSDSGPANIAASLDTPAIIISKAVPPNLRFIYRKKLIALYKYNFKEIKESIEKLA
jgi:ADP-heptose:LPS heptosyltransferase